jgi:hypothetical protein
MKLIYLATPYTCYPYGPNAAFEDAAAIAAALIKRGLAVFSPICHSHPIAVYGGIDAVDHELWMRIDREMWERCDELLVAKMPGWDQSRGIAAEIEYFLSHGKPVTYTEVGSILAPRVGPDYDPASAAFWHGDLKISWWPAWADKQGYRYARSPDGSSHPHPVSAPEIAAADGAGDYGNPVTPGCAISFAQTGVNAKDISHYATRQSDSWSVSYGGKRP